jgi:hypothetical protein
MTIPGPADLPGALTASAIGIHSLEAAAELIIGCSDFTLSSHLSELTCRESKSGKIPRAARGLPRMSVAGSKRRPAANLDSRSDN